MLSEGINPFLYAFFYRLFFGIIILSISSICLFIHFYLGNSFSVIQGWFELYLVEVIGVSSLLMLFFRKYLNGEKKSPQTKKLNAKKDSLLLLNYFIISFFMLMYSSPDFSFNSFRGALFFTTFLICDFLNSENSLSKKILSIRLRYSYYITHLLLSFFTFFVFFDLNHKFSYVYIVFQSGLLLSNDILKWESMRLVKFFTPLILFFLLCLGGNLLFPLSETRLFNFTLLFFSFNLVTFVWHKSFYQRI